MYLLCLVLKPEIQSVSCKKYVLELLPCLFMGKKLMFKLGEGVCLMQVNRVASIVYILSAPPPDLSSGHNAF